MTYRNPRAAERRAAASRYASRQEIRDTVQRLKETPAQERPAVLPAPGEPEAPRVRGDGDETPPTASRRKRSRRKSLWRRTWETARAECGLNLSRAAHWLAQRALRVFLAGQQEPELTGTQAAPGRRCLRSLYHGTQ